VGRKAGLRVAPRFTAYHQLDISPRVASAKGYEAAARRLPCYWPVKANVYVDGLNLYFGAAKDTPYRRLNIDALRQLLLLRDRSATMRSIADGQRYQVPSTIDDPAILPEIEEAVETIGCGKA